MATQHHIGRLVGATTVALAVSVLVPVSGPAAAAPPTLRISDTRPIAGEVVKVRADLPGRGVRPIKLQKRTKKRWVTVATKRSNRKVAATFKRRITTKTTFRAVTADSRKRRVSQRVAVRPHVQRARLDVATAVGAGESVRATATFSPARKRRPVNFQQRVDGTWRTVATTRQDTRGRATAALSADGAARYRAVAVRSRGAAAVASPTTAVPAASTPTVPTPDPPAPRCDEQREGAVDWGARDTTHRMRAVSQLRVETDGQPPIERNDPYSGATLEFIDADGTSTEATAKMRVRGNSTSWIKNKLPYKIKLDKAAQMHGMPAGKDWVLLANFYDRSMLRNDVGFEIARRLCAPWTPRMQPVELVLNGDTKGLYQFGEQIKADKERVNLPEGAALLEADSYADDEPSFTTDRGLQVFVKSVKSDDEAAPHAAHFREAEDALYSSDYTDPVLGYRAKLDVASFVDSYLLAELTKNIDAVFNNSVWMVIDADGRLAAGPAWDFDQGQGNNRQCEIDQPTGWYINRPHDATSGPLGCPITQMTGPEGHWYERLLSDPWFAEQVRLRWREVRAELGTIPDYVSTSAATIAEAADRNFAPRPGGADHPIGATDLEPADRHVFHDTWDLTVGALTEWLETRLAWLDAELN